VDALLDADAGTPVGDVRDGMLRLLGRPAEESDGEPSQISVAGVIVDPGQSLADSPLREAATVALGPPAAAGDFEEPEGLVEVRLVGGPGAGSVYRLDIGEYDAGAGDGCSVRLDDGELSGRSLRLRVAPDGRCFVRPVENVPASLDGAPLDGEQVWPQGAQVALGRTLLELDVPTHPDAALQPSDDGAGFDYNRPPRLNPLSQQARFRLPVPPTEQEGPPLPLIAALLPLVVAGAAAYLFHNYFFLLFAVLSPVSMIANYVSGRRRGRASVRTQRARYEKQRARIEDEARATLRREQSARRAASPDPAEALLVAIGPRRRLWERRQRDDDSLVVRVGTADLPSQVVLEDPARDEYQRQVTWNAADVPVTIPLRQHGVVGIAGSEQAVEALSRWIVAQAAVLHSPSDLQIVVLTAADSGQQWGWVRWLPHLRPQAGQDTLLLVGNDTDSLGRRVAELTTLIAGRAAVVGDGRWQPTSGDPEFLVVLHGARRLRSLPGVVQLLRDGPRTGVYTVCLDVEERLLPEECQAIVVEREGRLRVQQERAAAVEGVRPDQVGLPWCHVVARALGPIRDVTGNEEEAALPASCRLLDLLDLEPPRAAAIAASWQVGGLSTRAPIGISLDGTFSLDLRDGPHGLVAGTTGSGKSELLQTLVASLSVANRPDGMNFVLVDYKGGSAFKDCVQLPHTVGMVTDLDAHLVQRAVESLSAELRRRERVLAAAGAKDIEDYVVLRRREAQRPPLPRLLIVIDEFASLARELPDFITSLVSIAQRGRSLGIHLILATQRPAGVVSAEIRANTNLRIALRMTDASESYDVLDAPDAAKISRNVPGRAYIRLGQGSLLPFQTARVGGRRPGSTQRSIPEPWLAEIAWRDLGGSAPRRPAPLAAAEEVDLTDLSELVRAIREANDSLGVPAQPAPWLPPLPDALLLEDLPSIAPPDGTPGAPLPPVPYGLLDLPAEQAQRPIAIDLATFGHMHVIGSPRSGRSQALRTIAGAVARAHSCADVHLYGVDCGNGALLPLADLPHCGAVVPHTEVERLIRLVARLLGELGRRQALLAERGVADLTELRGSDPPGERPPHVLVLVDRWETFDRTFAEYDGGSLLEAVLRLFREGASVGIHLVVAGDRVLFSTRFSPTTEDKLVLHLNDRADYGMSGIASRQVPDRMPPGRALRVADTAEVQIALLAADAGGAAQTAALRRIAGAAAARDAAVPAAARPFRVDALPARLSFADAWGRRAGDTPALWGLIGVGGDELAAVGPDLTTTPTFIVAGPGRSGRSTLLATMARSFLASGVRMVVLLPRPSPLRELAGQAGVVRVFDRVEPSPEELRAALDEIGEAPGVVIVDDAELLREARAGSELSQLARATAGPGRALVIAGEASALTGAFVTWIVEAKRSRQGALLSPQALADGDLIGVRLPRSLLSSRVEPGRALVHLGDGRLITVRVPEP